VDENGNLVPLDQEGLTWHFDGAPSNPNTEKALTSSGDKRPIQSQTGEDGQVSRVLKDGTVYKTYFRSMGYFNAWIFLISGITFAITLKFPGKQNLCYFDHFS
jgi:hypothetical protein